MITKRNEKLGIVLVGDQWLQWWSEDMTYDEWEDARECAAQYIILDMARQPVVVRQEVLDL